MPNDTSAGKSYGGSIPFDASTGGGYYPSTTWTTPGQWPTPMTAAQANEMIGLLRELVGLMKRSPLAALAESADDDE